MRPIIQKLWMVMAMLCLSISASAYHFSVDGIYYNIIDAEQQTVEITYKNIDYNSYGAGIIVPTEVMYDSKTYSVTSIGDNAFFKCKGLTSVTIPTSVTSIGSQAFDGCSSLTSITIPNSVTSIESSVFQGCSGLTSVTIPNSVTSIEWDAFKGCSGLTSVIIPNSVTSIGSSAFSGCSGLISVTIPNSVTSIGDDAFSGCSGLTSVTIPNSVTSIGGYVFSGCSGMTSLNIPNSVTSIDRCAFRRCSGLTSVTIPNSVTSIGVGAFYDCSGLQQLFLEDSDTLLEFEESVFLSAPIKNAYIGRNWKYSANGSICPEITSVTFGDKVTKLPNYAFYGCSGLTSMTIPTSITSIGGYAFSGCSGLTSMTIPTSITSIGGYAFSGCSGLTSMTIPISITSIGKYAFSDCNGLQQLSVEDGDLLLSFGESVFDKTPIKNAYIGRNWKYSNKASIFSTITSVTLGEKVSELPDYAFNWCSKLTSVNIPNSVTSIGRDAFYYCKGLTSVNIPNSVTSIGVGAFSSCSGLTSLIIPNSVVSISAATFQGCSGLTSVTIPNSVTSIGNNAFRDCSKLVAVTLEDGDTHLDIGNEVFTGTPIDSLYVGRNCSTTNFLGIATGITKLTISSSVTSIAENTFRYCTFLKSVIIPSSVRSIGYDAFKYCKSLIKSAYPNTKSNPFECGYTVAYDPEGVIIEDGFIWGPKKSSILFAPYSLEGEYVIPECVSSIGSKAFCGCDSIKTITSYAIEAPTIEENAFEGLYEKATLSFPKNALLSYLGSNWGLFKSVKFTDSDLALQNYSDGILDYNLLAAESETDKNIAIVKKGEYGNFTSVTVPERVVNDDGEKYYVIGVGPKAFANYSDLKDIKFHNKSIVSSIGESAFEGTGISAIALPNTVTTIGKAAFKNSLISKITIPNTVNSIGESAFESSKISSIDLPTKLKAIEKYTFRWTPIQSITIPDSVTSIGNGAFYGCSSLYSVIIPNTVTSIGQSAFYANRLNSIKIPAGVLSIGKSAFEKCKYLYQLTMLSGNSELSIDEDAFKNCDITLFYVDRNWKYSLPTSICPKVKYVEIGSKVTTLPDYAFSDCINLKACGLPNSVNSIGNGSFQNSSISEIAIPNSVSSIGKDAFRKSLITAITLPNSVTSVGESAFATCTALSKVHLGNGLKAIADSTFTQCTLSKIVLPPSVETIGNSAFASNPYLEVVAMGANVKSIGDNAFSKVPVDSLLITAPEPPMASNTVFSMYGGCLYVQGETAKSAYSNASSCWNKFDVFCMSEPQSLKMEKPKTIEGKTGETFTLTATLTPANVDLPYVFWRSTDPKKAYVDNYGKVTVLQDITADDNLEIIAETLYHNGPVAKFSFYPVSNGVDNTVGDTTETMDVYTLQGVQVLHNATRAQFDNLARGIYIVRNGKDVKKVVK